MELMEEEIKLITEEWLPVNSQETEEEQVTSSLETNEEKVDDSEILDIKENEMNENEATSDSYKDEL